jgi:CheY-like chemotaxis protein
VIDDREVSRQAMTTMLRAEGAEVLHFDSGAASREELLALRSGGQKLDGVFVSQLIDKEAADKLKAGRSAASDADCLPFAYYGGTKDGGGEVYGSCSFRLSHPVLAQTVGEALHFIRGQRRSAALARVDSREPSAPAAAAAAPKHDKPVLIVDDVLANRKLAETVLQRAGYATVTASDGVEAEALASMRDYAVILMDVYMPNMDGKEATRRIRRSGGPNEDTVIIAVTASCTAVERQTILAAGIDAIVTKPVNFKELEETIEDILARRELAQSISDSQA